MSEIFGVERLLAAGDLGTYLARLALNLVAATAVIRLVYYRLYRNREYVFTYFLFNVITFSLCLLLGRVPIELGFALGLFAVFGILRYRTEPIGIRDLTYLFIVIGLGIVNAVANHKISLAELVAVNACVVGLTALLELGPGSTPTRTTVVTYDNLDKLRQCDGVALRLDLEHRTGLRVVSADIRHIDLLRDAAEIVVTYRDAR